MNVTQKMKYLRWTSEEENTRFSLYISSVSWSLLMHLNFSSTSFLGMDNIIWQIQIVSNKVKIKIQYLLSLLVSLCVVEAYLLNPLLSDGLVSLRVSRHATYLGLGRVQLILQKNHLGICCLQLVFIFCHVIPKTLHLLHLIRWKCKMYCK